MDNNNFEPNTSEAPQYSYILNGEPVYESGKPKKPKRPRNPRNPGKRGGASVLSVIIAILVLLSRVSDFTIDIGSGGTVSKGDLWGSSQNYDEDMSDDEMSDDAASRGTVHYSEMVYVRPDVDAMFARIDHIEEICFTASYDEIVPLLDEVYADYWHFDTMYCIADVKSAEDTTDEYYYNECLFLSENYSLLDQKIEELHFALAACPLADELDEDYYGEAFLAYYTGESTYDDELVALYQREAELVYEYQALFGAPTVEIDGETVYVNEYLSENMYNTDKYYECLELYYEKYGQLAGEIYVELVQVRHEIAAYFGYDSYIDYAYDAYERDYDPDDVREYVKTVTLGVVPLYIDMYNSGELFDYTYPGQLTPEENQAALKSAAKEMGGRIYDIYLYMENYGLFDIEISEYKANYSYQTYFEDWSAPYLSIDATGTLDDYTGFAHEFGHFIDTYINYNTYITTDASEACSQAMEFLAVLYSSALGSDSDEVMRMKMVSVVTLYAEQGAYNAFEEAIFAVPPGELTPEMVTEIAHDVFLQYGLLFEEDHEMYDNMWIDIPHFFSNPFYIVSYIISNDAAFQIYQQEVANPGEGVDTFVALADRRWDMNYLENLEYIGLDASFSVDRANAIIDSLYAYFE